MLAHNAIGVTPTHLDDLASKVYRQAKIDGSLQFEALLFGDAPPDPLFGRFVGDYSGLDGLGKRLYEGWLRLGFYSSHALSWVIVFSHLCFF